MSTRTPRRGLRDAKVVEPARAESLRGTLRLIDVAEASGVSLSTASRSLRRMPGVTETLAAQVRRTADELGYVVNAHAQTLTGETLPVVGMIVPDIDDPYFAQLAAGVVRAAAEHNLMVQLTHERRRAGGLADHLRSLVAHRVKAIILARGDEASPVQEPTTAGLLTTFQRNGGRAIAVGGGRRGLDVVVPDHRSAGMMAARHLLQLGHTEVMIVGDAISTSRARKRLDGAVACFRAAGVRPRIAAVEEGSSELGTAAVRAVRSWPATTAVMALPDGVARSVLISFHQAGVAVPAEISVIGFDDAMGAEPTRSTDATTVMLQYGRIGQAAVDLALRTPAARPRRKLVTAELATAGSTARRLPQTPTDPGDLRSRP